MTNMLMGYSKNQNAAKEFLAWITSKPVYQEWFNSQAGLLGRRDDGLGEAIRSGTRIRSCCRSDGGARRAVPRLCRSRRPQGRRGSEQVHHHRHVRQGGAGHVGRGRGEVGRRARSRRSTPDVPTVPCIELPLSAAVECVRPAARAPVPRRAAEETAMADKRRRHPASLRAGAAARRGDAAARGRALARRSCCCCRPWSCSACSSPIRSSRASALGDRRQGRRARQLRRPAEFRGAVATTASSASRSGIPSSIRRHDRLQARARPVARAAAQPQFQGQGVHPRLHPAALHHPDGALDLRLEVDVRSDLQRHQLDAVPARPHPRPHQLAGRSRPGADLGDHRQRLARRAVLRDQPARRAADHQSRAAGGRGDRRRAGRGSASGT